MPRRDAAGRMPSRPTIEYPDTPPEWLKLWPSEAEIRSLFPEGIRRLAYRFMGSEPRKGLVWSPAQLRVNIGNQQATWRLQGTQWRRSCTCGYHSDRCPHAYIAACLLNEVIRHEGWRGKESRAPAAKRDRGTGTSAPRSAPPPAGHRPSRRPASSDRARKETAVLEVEADFHHEPDTVVMRFYRR